MDRTISYDIDSYSEGLRVEQFLRRKGYSAQNLSTIKRMPESILVNGVHYYMKQALKSGDRLLVRIQETESSRNIPPVCAPLSIVYEDEDLIVIRIQDTAVVGDIVVALDEDNENTLKIFGGIDEENGDVILRYANQTKYPDKEIRVKQLIVQGVAKHVIKAL